MAPRTCLLVLAVGLFAAGCTAPLDITKTGTLDSGTTKTYDLPAQPADQTVKVEVTSTKGEVNAFLVLAPKIEAFEKAGTAKAKADIAAGSALGANPAKLSGNVPPKTEARVYVELAGSGTTEITVKMTNRK